MPMESAAFWRGVTVRLSDAQREAICHVNGPLLVIAGPGSGKTTVITYRVAYLTQVAGIDPSSLLVVTFTKAAADSMKARTAQVAGGAVAARATFGTFHALAYRILRQADPGRRLQILDEGEQIYLIRQIMRQAGLNTDEETVLSAVSELSRMKADTQEPEVFSPRGFSKTDFRLIWTAYQEAKQEKGVLDFDDLLHETLQIFQHRPDLLTAYRRKYSYIMVDEFQDTNPVQWALVRLLSTPLNNLCVVGDDDQSIYGWRGASPSFLLDFPKTFPQAKVVTLDMNHRCPPTVVEASNRLAAHNKERFGKVISSPKEQGAPIKVLTPADSLKEAQALVNLIRLDGGPLSNWAVVYRTNQQAHVIAQVLAQHDIPFRALGGLPNLYKRWPVQDILAYLKAAAGQRTAIESVINRPNRYMSRSVIFEAKQLAARTGCDLLNAIGQSPFLRSWQLRPIEDLQDHLSRLSRLNAPDAIAYVRSIIGYDDYIKEYCAREGGASDEIFSLLSEVERTTEDVPIMAFLAQVESFSAQGARNAPDGVDAVTLVTCHKAKGLEYHNVVVVGAIDRLMPLKGSTDEEEERRLMYVAMTRSVERLWISAPRAYGGREGQPSPFLLEALGPQALKEAGLKVSEGKVTAPKMAVAAKVEEMAQRITGKPKAEPDRPKAVPDGVSTFGRKKEEAPLGDVRPVPKPARKRKPKYEEPDLSALPPELVPGMEVEHQRHGRGYIESIDATLRRVIIDFDGKRLSLDLAWCLGSPQFFRVVGRS